MLSKNNKNSDRKRFSRGCLREKGKESFVNITLSKKYDIVDEPLFFTQAYFSVYIYERYFFKESANMIKCIFRFCGS